MKFTNLGDELEALCKEATREIVLVAPFVKHYVLKKLVEYVDQNVPIKCLTRWRPEEIKNEVSDIEVWEIIKNRPATELYLLPNLHAKYYRIDQSCLLGSANLTQRGLGWAAHSNFEVLTGIEPDPADLNEFENAIFLNSVKVDEDVYKMTKKAVDALPTNLPVITEDLPFGTDNQPLDLGFNIWMPFLRRPERLYTANLGNFENMTTSSEKAARRDIRHFNIPTSLTPLQFNAYISALLYQEPIVRSLNTFLSEPRRFGEVRSFLATIIEPTPNLDERTEAWQTLMRWILYFLPEQFALKRPHHSEIIYRK